MAFPRTCATLRAQHWCISTWRSTLDLAERIPGSTKHHTTCSSVALWPTAQHRRLKQGSTGCVDVCPAACQRAEPQGQVRPRDTQPSGPAEETACGVVQPRHLTHQGRGTWEHRGGNHRCVLIAGMPSAERAQLGSVRETLALLTHWTEPKGNNSVLQPLSTWTN